MKKSRPTLRRKPASPNPLRSAAKAQFSKKGALLNPKGVKPTVRKIVSKYKKDPTELLAILRECQEKWRYIPPTAISAIADELDVSRVHVEGTATFYHFFSRTSRGKYSVYLNTSATAEMSGLSEVIQAFEKEVGVPFGKNTPDDLIGLRTTSCIGMSDQEPAAMINGVIFTRLTAKRVKALVEGMKLKRPIHKLLGRLGDGQNSKQWIHAEVQNQIRQKGPVFFTDYKLGDSLKAALQIGSLDVIEKVKASALRGRGGAGFSTGQKWAFCRAANAESRMVICNVDEGEPGTFKDRVLMTEIPELIFEGMTVAGYAIEAKEGILYLRGEYHYLREHLERKLKLLRQKNLLGRRILGTRFSFDIKIKEGAGAYICGEESALIESAEGKRGQPRNRPPFPVTSGYLHRPTIVNNPETFGCAAKIVLQGPDWFKAMGTKASSGVKLLSIAGDCEKPGIYEVEWGISVREVLDLCGAKNVQAVQIGGPSGVCVSEKQFDRKICYSDLGTGGAFTIFSQKRDLLSIVHNHIDFFKHESCGFCVPCRAGTALLSKSLEKIRIGNGTTSDVEGIKHLCGMLKVASRCGLGQSAPNPLLSTLENFPEVYSKVIRTDVDFVSQFDMKSAVNAASVAANRTLGPNVESED